MERHICGLGGYPWHIFSFKIIDKEKYLAGGEDEDTYTNVDKTNAIVFNPFKEESFNALPDYDDWDKLLHSFDVYVYNKDFKWGFMYTHEE